MVNPRTIDRDLLAVIGLIIGGIDDNEQVASLAKLHPEKDLAVIDWVKRVRADLNDTVDLKYQMVCLNHNGPINTVPCVMCNLNKRLPYRFTVRSMEWDKDKQRIERARNQKKKTRKQ